MRKQKGNIKVSLANLAVSIHLSYRAVQVQLKVVSGSRFLAFPLEMVKCQTSNVNLIPKSTVLGPLQQQSYFCPTCSSVGTVSLKMVPEKILRKAYHNQEKQEISTDISLEASPKHSIPICLCFEE